jgi:hypothetical protein
MFGMILYIKVGIIVVNFIKHFVIMLMLINAVNKFKRGIKNV